ncbi:MAG: type II toxin-antitoxin system prevent-host-death family antitoxin [Myxococcaceae bacterium]
MVAVKISDFKAQFSAYLRQVKAGQEIELLDRGTTVAKVVSPSSETQVEIIPPKKDPAGLGKLKSKIVHPFQGEIMDFLSEERERR